MSVLLRVVEVVELSLRNDGRKGLAEAEKIQTIQIVNRFMPGTTIGSFVQENLGYGGRQVGDSYTVGQAGAVGPNSSAQNISFQQVWNQVASSIELPALQQELSAVRAAMKSEASEPEHDIAVADVAAAEVAARAGDGPNVMSHLAKAGKWALGVASTIGAGVAAAAIKTALGL